MTELPLPSNQPDVEIMAMITAQILLTEAQHQGLEHLAKQTGKTRDQLILEAVVKLLPSEEKPDWREALRKARGIWKDRTDLPDLRELRKEWNRRLP